MHACICMYEHLYALVYLFARDEVVDLGEALKVKDVLYNLTDLHSGS